MITAGVTKFGLGSLGSSPIASINIRGLEKNHLAR